MPEIAFTQRQTSLNELIFGPEAMSEFCNANGFGNTSHLSACKAYSGDIHSPSTFSVVNFINSQHFDDREALYKFTQAAGEESFALAQFINRYFSEDNLAKMNSAVGAAATAAVTRLDGFEQKIVDYQKSLVKLWNLSRNRPGGRGTAAQKIDARAQVRAKFNSLQEAYAQELSRYSPTSRRGKNVGDALSNADRGITLATRKPNSP